MKTMTLSAILLCAGLQAAHAQYTLEQVATADKYSLQYSDGTLYARGDDAVYTSSDNGYTWTTWCNGILSQLGGSKTLSDAFVLSPGTAVITVRSDVSDSTFIYRTANGGQSWQLKYATEISQLAYSTRSVSGLSFSDPANGWAFGKGLILHTSNGGETWQPQFAHYESPYNSDVITDFCPVDVQHAWTSGYGAAILHTADAGATWAYQYANDTATAGNMADDPCYYIYGIHFNNGGHGYAAAGNGNYLRTANGGQTWTPASTGFPNDNVAAFSVHDSLTWLVGGDYCDNSGCYSGQSILYTTNGGQSWLSLHDTTIGPIGAYKDFRDVWFFDEYLGYTTRGDGTLWRIRKEGLGIAGHDEAEAGISPNPTSGIVHLALPDELKVRSVVVYTCHGQTVRELYPDNDSGDIDLTGLEPGVYHLLIGGENGTFLRGRVVKH